MIILSNKEVERRVIEGEYLRANGNCICSICQQEYKKHSILLKYSWLIILCDGQLVKL